jgi:hypothetical protein
MLQYNFGVAIEKKEKRIITKNMVNNLPELSIK